MKHGSCMLCASGPGAITKCFDLCPSVIELSSPSDFCLLHLSILKLVFSALLTKEDNGEKAQFRAVWFISSRPSKYQLSVCNAVEFRSRLNSPCVYRKDRTFSTPLYSKMTVDLTK